MTIWEKLTYRFGVALSFRQPPTLPAHGWSYFDHMVAVYLTLNVKDDRATAIIEKAASRPYGLTWSDIFLLENVILERQKEDEVRRKAWIIRERFREIAGPGIYAQYVQSGIPDAATCEEPKLRADLARVLDFLHWYYALIPIRERIRKTLTVYTILMVVGYLVLLLGILNFLSHHNDRFLATALTVVFCGVVGGFVSSQRRMQGMPTDSDPMIGVFGLENAGYYLWLSPLLGGIFAVVLTSLFMGDILKGTVFPEFVRLCSADTQVRFASSCVPLPKEILDYAKLFVWSFMAGFAEQLVPDSLDRLASKLDSSKQSQGAPLGPPTISPEPPTRVPPAPPAPPGKALGIDPEVIKKALETGLISHEQMKALGMFTP